MRYVPEFAKYMLENGLVFEINRKVLHPLGLALAMDVQEDNNETVCIKGLLVDDDPEGIVFDEETYEHGYNKYGNFLGHEGGNERLDSRFKGLGFIVQVCAKEESVPDGIAKIDFMICEEHGGWHTSSLDVPEDVAKKSDREVVKWAWDNHFSKYSDDIVHVGIYWHDPNVQENDDVKS